MNDLISREAAIEAVYQGLKKPSNDETLQRILDNLKQIPVIDYSQQWIPVSEGLPDDLTEVNVTWVNHNPEPYYDFIKDKPCTSTAVFYKKQWFWSSPTCVDYLAEYGRNDMCKVDDEIEITAWMPLPEPYKGD